MDTTWADSNDHDPIFGISDGENLFGFQTPDNNYYPNAPCYGFQGRSTDRLTSVSSISTGTSRPTVAKSYSSEVKMYIKPTEKWGSCHTEHDEGHIAIAQYSYIYINRISKKVCTLICIVILLQKAIALSTSLLKSTNDIKQCTYYTEHLYST